MAQRQFGGMDASPSTLEDQERASSRVITRWLAVGPRRLSAGGYRLDHLIVSGEVEVPVCGYLHQWRGEDLSDHSPPVGAHSLASEEFSRATRTMID
jgi:hypothetical protein